MNIVIPLGGLGERFKKDNYTEKKPLIKIFGKSMIFHVIDNLNLNKDDNLIIIYNKELNSNNFDNLLKFRYNNIILIELTKQTEGAAETIAYGLSNLNSDILKKKFVLLDCDTFYHINILDIYRKQLNNAIFCFEDNQDNPIYSYIKFSDDNIITDIKEKNKISNYANSGCYCFINGNILLKYCNIILEKNIRNNNEYYTSCVIDQMIQDKYIFEANIIKINDFTCVGTPLQLKIYCSDFSNNIEIKRFCFDLDNTLVTSPIIKGDYSSVLPIQKNIDMLKFLKKLGHTIIIYTARNMKTCNGNIAKVIKNIGSITIESLKKFDIPYDELLFGKPYADFYIDDLAVNAYDDLEKSLGFYKSIISERSFNEITNDKMDIILKKSTNNKIKGEIYFYKNLPNEIKQYFPLFLYNTENSYTMEKIKGIGLSFLFINQSLTEELFKNLLNIIHSIHFIKSNNNIININDIYISKIKQRYESIYNYAQFNDSNNIYNELIDFFNNYKTELYGITHGDLVFSNIILNNNNQYKFIDMRGIYNNILTIYSDINYDYAKIYQSLIGYDEILLNKDVSNEYRNKFITIFFNYIIEHYGKQNIYNIKMITKSHIFSLLPLHNNYNCIKFYNLINNI
jgi:hypothetical protein